MNPEEIVDPTRPEGSAELLIIKRHPFGLVALYLQVIVGLGLALALIYLVLPGLLDGDTKTTTLHYLNLFSVVSVGASLIFLLIATYIYRQNRWVVTDDSISQV